MWASTAMYRAVDHPLGSSLRGDPWGSCNGMDGHPQGVVNSVDRAMGLSGNSSLELFDLKKADLSMMASTAMDRGLDLPRKHIFDSKLLQIIARLFLLI